MAGQKALCSIELVMAVAENDVIGRGNQLPWRLPADLRRFKALTLGKPVLMGRKTYESIGRALPGRTNIVLTRASDFNPGDCIVVGSFADGRLAAGDDTALMVIGGAEIYRLSLATACCIHLTLVHADMEGDTYFDGWRNPVWREVARERHEADAANTVAHSFITLLRGPASAAPIRA